MVDERNPDHGRVKEPIMCGAIYRDSTFPVKKHPYSLKGGTWLFTRDAESIKELILRSAIHQGVKLPDTFRLLACEIFYRD